MFLTKLSRGGLHVLGAERNFLNSLSAVSSVVVRQMSSDISYNFETFMVKTPSEFVKNVEINRPEKRNAMNMQFVREIGQCFSQLAVDPDCRVVILTGAGKVFGSGIDLFDPEVMQLLVSQGETSRNAFKFVDGIAKFQDKFNELEKCPKPVIAAIHSACLGLAVDLITACDMRVCTQDAYFQIKEVDIGIAADIGVLQRFPKIVKNDSLVRELVYTTRKLEADEAKSVGLVSHVFKNQAEMLDGCLKLAQTLAAKSPAAIQGSKVNMVYSRDHSVAEGLEYTNAWQMAMLQSEDIKKAVTASFSKEKPTFSKL